MSKKTTRGSYPHPVLDSSDDIGSSIEVFNVTIAPTIDDVEIRFQIRMDDPDIQAKIDAKEIRYTFRWKCGSTIASEELEPQRVATHVDSTSYVAWISQEKIRRTVQVEIKLVAVEPIEGYRLQRQHQDYGNASFNIAAGDVLADGGDFTFEADKLYDPLNPPVGSCFKFVADRTLKRGVRIKWDSDDYVIVAFPEEVLPGLHALGSRQDLQVSLVVLPALMETIGFIKSNEAGSDPEDLSAKTWYTAIKNLVEFHGTMEQPSFELAQKILANPLDTFLSTPLFTDEDEEL
jgi:hypothetical protein